MPRARWIACRIHRDVSHSTTTSRYSPTILPYGHVRHSWAPFHSQEWFMSLMLDVTLLLGVPFYMQPPFSAKFLGSSLQPQSCHRRTARPVLVTTSLEYHWLTYFTTVICEKTQPHSSWTFGQLTSPPGLDCPSPVLINDTIGRLGHFQKRLFDLANHLVAAVFCHFTKKPHLTVHPHCLSRLQVLEGLHPT